MPLPPSPSQGRNPTVWYRPGLCMSARSPGAEVLMNTDVWIIAHLITLPQLTSRFYHDPGAGNHHFYMTYSPRSATFSVLSVYLRLASRNRPWLNVSYLVCGLFTEGLELCLRLCSDVTWLGRLFMQICQRATGDGPLNKHKDIFHFTRECVGWVNH